MKIGIIGATGLVGQKFVQLLSDHPCFEISELVASGSSAGKKYKNAVENKLEGIPARLRDKKVKRYMDILNCKLIFSALPSNVAGEIEKSLIERGYIVLTNASSHRMDPEVPLVIPEVNPEHIELVKSQKKELDKEGFIVANPNCSTIQLALALKPIHEWFGIEKINCVTLQALSGAGYSGINALEAADNVIPYIGDEEKKIENETLKIFGDLHNSRIKREEFSISASCNRVNVRNGHIENVSVDLKEDTSPSELKECLKEFKAKPQKSDFPTAPTSPVILSERKDRPQPRIDLHKDSSMSVHVGRVRRDNILDFKFIILGHNLIRGAAGASILNAELLFSENII